MHVTNLVKKTIFVVCLGIKITNTALSNIRKTVFYPSNFFFMAKLIIYPMLRTVATAIAK
jgi:hypothetical protein